MGVCLHPKFGVWFAMRSVFIFKNVILNENELSRPVLKDPLNQDFEKIIGLLKNFNYDWKSSIYRNAIDVAQKYSDIQIEYFTTEPKCRKDLLKRWLNFPNKEQLLKEYNKTILEIKRKDYLIKNFYLYKSV